jgi:hypothetical protein
MIKEILDKLYFKYSIKPEMVRKEDVEWMKDHAEHQIRIMESIKQYIGKVTFNNLTLREHQRRKDWFDCLSCIQKLCSDSKDKKSIDWVTGEKREKK